MAGFNLTAQLHLQAPTNTSAVVGNIKKQLSGISVNVQVKGNAGSLAKINKQMQGVSKSADASSKAVGNLNRNLSEAARRFSVITVATGTMLALARSIKNAVGEAIAFERELVKISQVTGKTVQNLQGLTNEVTKLSTAWGASSKELLNVSRVLAQAGFSAEKTRQALDVLAKTSLGATFDSLTDTTEGAIAVLRQFRSEAKAAGGDIKFLEKTMDAINSVSKQFAVESGDLITVIRRVGGVFESAGGSVNELIALFTSVRATTRESAETIATGLRTIFTRIQRTDTVDQLAALGIQLRDSQGQFVGAYEAVRRLSQGLSALDPRDFRFSDIVESLGGFRQVGKVIPLIRQFTTAQDALNVAQSASGSVARDALTAQQSLAVQAAKVKEEFLALARTLADSSTFRSVANGALEMARAFIRIVEALEPLLPLLTSLIALKIGTALAPGLGALAGVTRKSAGGRIHGYARGGFVPGTGNRDTVPAMLSPGEFVIKKSSVNKMGVGALEAMNNNRFRTGGKKLREEIAADRSDPTFRGKTSTKGLGVLRQLDSQIENLPENDVFGGAFLTPMSQSQDLQGSVDGSAIKAAFAKNKTFQMLMKAKGGSKLKKAASDLQAEANTKADFTLLARSTKQGLGERVESRILDGVEMAVRGGANEFQRDVGVRGGSKDMSGILRTTNIDNVIGNLFEASVLRAGAPFDDTGRDSANAPFDFPGGLGGRHESFENAAALASKDTDAKTRYTSGNINSFLKKVRDKKTANLTKNLDSIVSELTPDDIESGFATRGKGAEEGLKAREALKKKKVAMSKKAYGGKIDSVPALLTPGEYVINKSSAQSIGYGNLNKMNQTGVKRFATGGAVQRFATGGAVSAGDFGVTSAKDLAMVNAAAKKNADAFNQLTADIASFDLDSQRAAVVNFARNFDEAADEAAGLDAAMEAAHKAATEFGTGSSETRGKKKDRDPRSALPPEGPPLPPTPVTGDMFVEVEANIATFGGTIKENERTMLKFKQGMSKGMTKQDALTAALKDAAKRRGDLTTSVEEMEAASKSYTERLKDSGSNLLKRVKGSSTAKFAGAAKKRVAGAVGGIGRAAEGASGAAAAAQSIAFMGGAAIATAVQMSGLSEATKQAVTETVGFASGLLAAGGTAIQMLSGLAQIGKAAAAAETLETTSNLAATGTEEIESAANLKSAASEGAKGGMSGASKALVGVGLAAVAVSSTFKYFAASARASADQMKKSTDKLLADLEAGKGGDASVIQSGVQSEIGARGEAASWDSAAMAGGGAALAAGGIAAAAASAGLLGATLGSAVPVVGTVIGALVGVGIGLWMYNSANEEAAEAARKQADAINASIEGYVKTAQSLGTFNQTLGDIDLEKNLKPEERVSRRLAAGATLDTGAGNLPGEFEKLAALAQKLGKPISALTEADFEDMPAELQAFKFATKATAKTLEALSAKAKAARQTLSEAADISFTGEFSFDEVMAENGHYAQALRATQAAIKQETNGQISAKQAEVKSMRAAADARYKEMGPTKEAHAAWVQARQAAAQEEAKIGDMRKREGQQQKDLIDGQKAVADAAHKQREAELGAAAAAEALRLEMNAMSEAMKGVREIAAHQAEDAKGIAGRKSLGGNTGLDFSATKVQGLDDITAIDNLKKFDDQMNQLIDELPAGMRDNFRKMLATVEDTNKVFTGGKDKVLAQFGRVGTDEVNVDEIIAASGADLSKLAPEIQTAIRSQIAKAAASGGGISGGEFDEIFDPIRQLGETAATNLQEIEGLRDTEIKQFGDYLDVLQSERDKQLEGERKVLQAQATAAQLMAKATGRKLTTGEMDTQRNAAAQVGLKGTGAKAGDVAGVAAAKAEAQKRRASIEKMIRQDNLSISMKKKLMAEDKRLIDVVKKTGNELERLGDQSEKAAEIMDGIEDEKAKRDTITNLLGDFVKGGDAERESITNALMGVQSAVATGTVQNQNPEQRAATFDMLDKLKDIPIMGAGGLTGDQVKQEIIFRDAIQMGLDPMIAEKLATATSKEQELINALEKLTQTTIDAQRRAQNQVFASGGLVQYRAGGGNIFQPRGTDTVPAMLTPGEFVIKKSAVDKIGMGTLAGINNGRYANGGLVQYRAAGGGINPLAQSAGGVGGNTAVKIPTGDMYKQMFYQSLAQISPKDFIKFAKTSGALTQWAGNAGVDEKEIIKGIMQLKKAGQLDITKMAGPDQDAATLDRITTASRIFHRLDDQTIQFKNFIQPLDLANASHTAVVQRLKESRDLNSEYKRIAGGQSIAQLNTADPNSAFAGAVINSIMGINTERRIRYMQQLTAKRAENMDSYINWLQAAGPGVGAGWVGTINLGAAPAAPHANFGIAGGRKDVGDDPMIGGVDRDKKPKSKKERHLDGVKAMLRKAGVFYLEAGGRVPGFAQGGQTDTVPAMLTPGEFVMSRDAVQKHGVGYMKNLNKGRIPGFNRGGLVGKGAVQYKQAGGGVGEGGGSMVLSLDPTNIQQVLSEFNATFSATIDNIVAPFNSVAESLGTVAAAFGSMTMTHVFSGNLTLSVNIGNKDAIVAAVSEGIKPKISELITRTVDASIEELKNSAGG